MEFVIFSGVYLCLLIILSAISLMCTSVVMNIYLRDPPVPMSPIVYKFVFQWIGRMVLYRHNSLIAVQPVNKGQSMSVHSLDVDNPETSDNNKIHVSDISLIKDPNVALILEVRKLTKKLADDEQEDCQRFQWKEAARIFDRLFFIMFAFINFFMVLAVFLAI